MEQPLFTVESSSHDGVLKVSVVGEVDMDTAPRIRAALGSASTVVLDLEGVTFFGSAGIQLLVDAQRRVRDLAVVATRRPVLRPLSVTGLAPYLSLCPSPDEALDHVRRGARSHVG
ncbi:STAS domain-containing protein [Actinosynnema sp. CS-041913]|uniref:STAS domain-containing protein n=1 Tax=Actinosynnema sp. CS-041913 TaxID=3239917 RepID=UPI003D9233B1